MATYSIDTRLRLGLRHLDIVPLGGTVHLCGQTDKQTDRQTDKHPESCSENMPFGKPLKKVASQQ